MKKLFSLFALALIGLIACEKDPDDQNKVLEPGVLFLQMGMPNNFNEVTTVTGVLSKDRFETVEFELEINKQAAYGFIHGIEGGKWILQVYAQNAIGDIICSRLTEVEIIPNDLTTVYMDWTDTYAQEISIGWGGDTLPEDDRFEDNDLMEEATQLYEAKYYQNLYIESGEDDWFEISLSAPHIEVVINYHEHPGDIRLELFSPEGTLLASSKNYHHFSIIDYYANQFGTLYIRVFSPSGQSRTYLIMWDDWYDV